MNTPKKKALIVEDNLLNQKVITKFLDYLGHDFDTAENGEIGVKKWLEDDSFDIIFMDIQMPVMDGLEASKKIRALEKERNRKYIPIIAVTAFKTTIPDQKILDVGIDKVLSKPINRNILQKTIEKYAI